MNGDKEECKCADLTEKIFRSAGKKVEKASVCRGCQTCSSYANSDFTVITHNNLKEISIQPNALLLKGVMAGSRSPRMSFMLKINECVNWNVSSALDLSEPLNQIFFTL